MSGIEDGFLATYNTPKPRHGAAQKTRACENCARLKMKCQWPTSRSSRPETMSNCVRCARMKLPCHIPEALPRRKRGKSTRVAQLEKKIDGLATLLAASQHVPREKETPALIHWEEGNGPTTAENITSVQGDGFYTVELFPEFRIGAQEAAKYLVSFQQDYMPKFPFVIIPLGVTAHVLYSDSPCLFWVIMGVVAPRSAAVQRALKRWFKTYIAEHVVVREEKRLDLFQAILIHIAWGDFHFYIDGQATALFQLATSLALDLRLDKVPGAAKFAPNSLSADANKTLYKGEALIRTKPQTAEEMRAVLGLYHITSLMASLFRRGGRMQWTPHLERCCESLAEAREWETDLYIYSVMKMQCIADRVDTILPGPEHGYGGDKETAFRGSLAMALGNIHRELTNFFDAQPRSVRGSKIFQRLYYVLIMRLYDPVISMRSASLTSIGPTSSEPFQRAEALWTCLRAGIDYFQTQLSAPVSEIQALPFPIMGLVAYTMITASRLLLDSSPDWDAKLARRALDYADIMGRMADQFEEADRLANETGTRKRLLDDGGSVFSKYSFKLRWVRHWYLSRISQEHTISSQRDDTPVSISTPRHMRAVAGEGDQDWGELLWFHDQSLIETMEADLPSF